MIDYRERKFNRLKYQIVPYSVKIIEHGLIAVKSRVFPPQWINGSLRDVTVSIFVEGDPDALKPIYRMTEEIEVKKHGL